ncbi:hypothetical protein Pcinc_043176 [Petrolisthes cinctipes]|uniref:Uncharacterized protein n=1 Tax=Petrolisthes cinctipes TaxID=88211 RepID=A0AAE1BH76_PETCI|nr:hypothetical protein Pcinc_043176 [Petrolisthes cinctipes]
MDGWKGKGRRAGEMKERQDGCQLPAGGGQASKDVWRRAPLVAGVCGGRLGTHKRPCEWGLRHCKDQVSTRERVTEYCPEPASQHQGTVPEHAIP